MWRKRGCCVCMYVWVLYGFDGCSRVCMYWAVESNSIAIGRSYKKSVPVRPPLPYYQLHPLPLMNITTTVLNAKYKNDHQITLLPLKLTPTRHHRIAALNTQSPRTDIAYNHSSSHSWPLTPSDLGQSATRGLFIQDRVSWSKVEVCGTLPLYLHIYIYIRQ